MPPGYFLRVRTMQRTSSTVRLAILRNIPRTPCERLPLSFLDQLFHDPMIAIHRGDCFNRSASTSPSPLSKAHSPRRKPGFGQRGWRTVVVEDGLHGSLDWNPVHPFFPPLSFPLEECQPQLIIGFLRTRRCDAAV